MSVPSTSPGTTGVVAKGGMHSFGKTLLGFLLVCLVLELGLRLFGFGSYVIYRPDERLLWVPMPGSHKVTEVNHQPETISPQGFRYQEVLPLQHPGIYRIFTFGDSTTMGWGVADGANYSGQLEKLLNSQGCLGRKFQVVSAGVNAYPNALVEERMMKVVEDGYEPDAVIIAYSANTGFEGIPDLQGSARESFLMRVKLKSIARRSAIYNFLIEYLLRNYAYYRFRELLMLGTWDSARSSPDLPAAHFLAKLEKAKEVAHDHHVQMILLLLGSKNESYPAHPYQQAMAEYARENNIPLVNMIDVMRSQNQDQVFMDHVHPSELGHVMIAQQLLPAVRGLSSYAATCGAGSGNSVALTSLSKSASNQP